jgi:hypothetical protein
MVACLALNLMDIQPKQPRTMDVHPFRRRVDIRNLAPLRDPRRLAGMIQFMHEKTTFESLRSKLSALSGAYGLVRDPYDLDTFLALAAGNRFYDLDLGRPPSVASVRTLARLGVDRWALTSKGIVDEVENLLASGARRVSPP